jgi:hypothetical protein
MGSWGDEGDFRTGWQIETARTILVGLNLRLQLSGAYRSQGVS